MSNQKPPRRSFLKKLSNLGLAGFLGSALPAFSQVKSSESATSQADKDYQFLTQPYLQCFSPNEIIVRWMTNKPGKSWVAYGEDKNLNNIATPQVKLGFVEADNTVNTIILKNLKPGKTYYYKVCSKEITSFTSFPKYGLTIESQVFSFTAADEHAKEVSMLILNDTHDRPESIPHLISLNKNKPFNFTFFNGDIFTFVHNEPQIIDHFIKPVLQSLGSTKPFMFVRGNHETRGRYARQFDRYFLTHTNQFYSTFNWGPVQFMVLDTGEDKVDTHNEYAGVVDFDDYRVEQGKWAESVMKSKAFKRARYRVVLMHIPHFNSDEKHGTTHVRKLFHPLFEKYKVDIVLSGHTHTYGIHPPDEQHSYPLIIGGGPEDGKRTLIQLHADANELKVNMLRDDGVDLGNYIIKS
ncbi:metallophosphoesterase family protein [Pedobacter frigidisoli]|uniref:metallophosphoesterase family protein n=1 Tax=Pedobacter frigidisoli TaxID=2530455 RepID=UPI00292FC958|nr:metallophosphoesterase family protein [Pedobacter frigidisoli]